MINREKFQRHLSRGFKLASPQELLLERPSEDRLKESKRFVQGAIEAEIPLNLVLGRPKVLQLSAVPLRLYVPDDDVVRTEIIDQKRTGNCTYRPETGIHNHDPVVR